MEKNSNILVTGATGLIGTHLVNLLLEQGHKVRAISHKRKPSFITKKNLEILNGDLTNSEFCLKACNEIDYVFHLAVETGSIVKNSKHPASIMTPTILMDFNMLKAAHDRKVKKYLYCSCACVYPSDIDNMIEESAWDGAPPKSHETISWSKRIAELQCRSFHKEFGDKITIVRPSNTYGPYDTFNLEDSHVISAFIKKAVDKINPFVIWGNGEQIREFVHALDIARGMLKAIELWDNAEPINLGGGTAIKIKDLAEMIMKISNEDINIQFDIEKPSGHMKRILNSEKCQKILSFSPEIKLEDGLKETINWYKNNK
jgi:GDP-L-fucose synthase